jgi:hypothetical protein
MGLKESLRESWKRLVDGEPGQRFRSLYRYRRKGSNGPGSFVRAVTLGVGVLLLGGGLVIGWLPGPGGFVAVLGAMLIATEWYPLARLLDGIEVPARRSMRAFALLYERSSTPRRVIIALAFVGLTAGVSYLVVGALMD